MRECLKDRRLQWFGHLKRKGQSARSSKHRTFKVSSSFIWGRPRKTQNEVIRSDLSEGKSTWTQPKTEMFESLSLETTQLMQAWKKDIKTTMSIMYFSEEN